MKTTLPMAALLAMLTLSACQTVGVSPGAVSGAGGGGEAGLLTYATAMQKVDAGQPAVLLWIQGIACPFWGTKIDQQLLKIDGVLEVAITLDEGRAVALLADGLVPPKAAFEQAIEDAGLTLIRVEMPE